MRRARCAALARRSRLTVRGLRGGGRRRKDDCRNECKLVHDRARLPHQGATSPPHGLFRDGQPSRRFSKFACYRQLTAGARLKPRDMIASLVKADCGSRRCHDHQTHHDIYPARADRAAGLLFFPSTISRAQQPVGQDRDQRPDRLGRGSKLTMNVVKFGVNRLFSRPLTSHFDCRRDRERSA